MFLAESKKPQRQQQQPFQFQTHTEQKEELVLSSSHLKLNDMNLRYLNMF